MEQEVHKVQILDTATGTGTFMAEVVKQIHKKFQGQQVAELSEAKSEAEANRLIKQLNSSYESYHAFFE